MIKITTESGYTCEIAKDAYDKTVNYKALMTMLDSKATNSERDAAYNRLMDGLLGSDQMKKLEAHAPTRADYLADINEIFKQYNEAKKK